MPQLLRRRAIPGFNTSQAHHVQRKKRHFRAGKKRRADQ
jgi:hypothetical protein